MAHPCIHHFPDTINYKHPVIYLLRSYTMPTNFKDSKILKLNNIIVVDFMDLGTRVNNVFKIVFTIKHTSSSS